MNKITTSAPGKLILYGEHSVVYERPCIVTAVDQRLTVQLSAISNQLLEIEAPDVGIAGYQKPIEQLNKGAIPKGVRFVEGVVSRVYSKYSITDGIRIETSSDFASTVGFGSSSASAVCTAKGLSELFNLNLSNRDLFDICYQTVLDIQGVGSGFDIASAIWGGILYFMTGGKAIESLSVDHLPMIVGYSGVKADTASIVKDLKSRYEGREDKRDALFDKITVLVEQARIALGNNAWKEAGELMNKNQKLLVMLGVSSKKLDVLNEAAIGAGAYGAKLSGAGGGDCMIAFSSDEKREAVEKAIEIVSGEIIHVSGNAEGVRVEK